MSVFEAREWWASPDGEDMCTGTCLAVDAVVPSQDGSFNDAQIVAGTFSGSLRVYQPSQGGFQPEHLLLEATLPESVIQVRIGRFSSDGGRQLAILHPRSVAVYKFTGGYPGSPPTKPHLCDAFLARSTAVNVGNQRQLLTPEVTHAIPTARKDNTTTLQKVFQIKLKRTAANFASGVFGGSRPGHGDVPVQSLCVQSMDGVLSVCDGADVAFERFLPNFLLPGPLCYVAKTDSFVTVNSSCQLESYRYLTLANASSSQKDDDGRRLKCDWSMDLGEQVLEVAQAATQTPTLVVLGEQTVFWVSGTGTLRFSKRMNVEPSCCQPYRVEEDVTSLLVASHDNTLTVMQDARVGWCAALGCNPVALCVASFDGVQGLIVYLREDSRLACIFLGTDPQMPVVAPPTARHLDYDAMDAEMAGYQQQIRSTVLNDQVAPTTDVLSLALQGIDGIANSGPGADYSHNMHIQIRMHGGAGVDNILLSVHVPTCVRIDRGVHSVVAGPTGVDEVVSVRIGAAPAMPVSTLTAVVTAAYTTGTDEPRSVSCQLTLPLELVTSPAAPEKSATNKLTIVTDKPPVDLGTLFPRLATASSAPALAVAAKHTTGAVVSILASKSSGRYRVQCESLGAIYVVAESLCARLLASSKAQGMQLSFEDDIPLPALFPLIDAHLSLRHQLADERKRMDAQAQQFIAIQKRLLARYKDKTPSPLQRMDELLDKTNSQMVESSERVDSLQAELQCATEQLTASANLIVLLLRLKHNLDASQEADLAAAIAPALPSKGDMVSLNSLAKLANGR